MCCLHKYCDHTQNSTRQRKLHAVFIPKLSVIDILSFAPLSLLYIRPSLRYMQWLLTPVPLEHTQEQEQEQKIAGVATDQADAASAINTTSSESPTLEASRTKMSTKAVGEVNGEVSEVLEGVGARVGEEAVTAAAVRTKDPATMVALGGSHSLAATSSGKVFGFGRQEHGRLGAEDMVKKAYGIVFFITEICFVVSKEKAFMYGMNV